MGACVTKQKTEYEEDKPYKLPFRPPQDIKSTRQVKQEKSKSFSSDYSDVQSENPNFIPCFVSYSSSDSEQDDLRTKNYIRVDAMPEEAIVIKKLLENMTDG